MKSVFYGSFPKQKNLPESHKTICHLIFWGYFQQNSQARIRVGGKGWENAQKHKIQNYFNTKKENYICNLLLHF